jgi:hypothetical protein
MKVKWDTELSRVLNKKSSTELLRGKLEEVRKTIKLFNKDTDYCRKASAFQSVK